MDPYRKTQPGQPLRVSSRAWNRMLDGVAGKTAPLAGGARVMKLPAIESYVAKGYGYVDDRPLVVGEAVVLLPGGSSGGNSSGVDATTPLALEMSFSEAEGDLYRSPRMYYATMRPAGGLLGFAVDQPFAVCADPVGSVFAVAGFCWARVRTLAHWHNYARRCVAQPSDSDAVKAASVGCLDSCGYGPARIIGWASQDSSLGVASNLGVDGGNGSIYWALIRF